MGWVCGWGVHIPSWPKFIIEERRNSMEAVACVMKYFVAASIDRWFFLLIRSGVIPSRLISSPIHIIIWLVLSIVIMGPKIIVREMISKVRGLISTGRV